ncbi:LuxR family transcriptional regulator [Streptomyces sp. H27-C3]|uniref:helix-turn-helix transcriptional regulator n=1 Tax=Streptomyces sp. H27-C3 TaxID=3046305 RepID=UPI0024B9BEEF|nr:LuxR family transcriptional regulator [Streptomyces sp. H27-C3]MDJ0463951.1 LuxR C-terminal-related transcriptional regulator [Streptomyces sp. H27-C3]
MTPTTTVRSPLRLCGRSGELAILDQLSERLRDGHGSALVISAPPGLGRSGLLRHAMVAHGELPLLHTRAVAARGLLPYSGLHALLCSAPGSLPRGAAHVTRAELTPIALLDLLRALGSRRPLLVCVDDAQAWDPDSRVALGFAARRLEPADHVAVLVTLADFSHSSGSPYGPGAQAPFGDLPQLRLGPLDTTAATELCARLTGQEADPVVREALCREAAGNPRLLTALAEQVTPDQLAGRTPLPHPLPGGEALLDAYAARTEALPAETRLLLLLAAAAHEHEPDGAGADAAVLTSAARLAGIDPDRLRAAERADVVRSDGTRVRFTHPLLRTAILRRSPAARLRAAHHLLAATLDAPHQELPHLVQRALAASVADPLLADALAAVAVEPRPYADRAVALARAADLTTDVTLRDVRFAASAEQAWHGGDPGRARALLTRVRAVPAPGRVHYVRGLLALRDGPVADARESLLTAAALLTGQDTERAADALLGAAEAAWAMGDAAGWVDALRRASAVSKVPSHGGEEGSAAGRTGPGDGPAAPKAVLGPYVEGMLAVFGGRMFQGRVLLRDCIEGALRAGDPAAVMRAGVAALVIGDVEGACRSGGRALAAVRAHGPEVQLPQALEYLAYGELRVGRHALARAHAEEGLRAAARLGQRNIATHLHAVLALTASVEGDGAICAGHAQRAAAGAGSHGLTQAATLATWAVARAELARGLPAEAAARLFPLVRRGPRRGHFAARMLAVPCLVEAAVLAGRTDEALDAVEEFTRWAADTADPLAPAQLARCRALVAPPESAADRYMEALAQHERAGGDFERARTLLLYGHWLRRRRRTREARGPLRDALVAFERCGAQAWWQRAAGELRAAGEAVADGRGNGLLDRLTPQQRRIARHVAEGATNREVALRLSVSTRTVDHHLRNVFSQLGVRSRTELARILEGSGRSR